MAYATARHTGLKDLQQTLDDLSMWEGVEPDGPEMEALVDLVVTLLSDQESDPRHAEAAVVGR